LGLDAKWSLTFDEDGGLGFCDEVMLDSGEAQAASRTSAASSSSSATPPQPPPPPPLWSRSGYDPLLDTAWDCELGSGVCRATAGLYKFANPVYP
jgi:hypothetical protein